MSEKNRQKINGPPPDGGFDIRQSTLPQRLGLPIEEIRARRERYLQEEIHWRYKAMPTRWSFLARFL
jgi:hypothetical protein